MIKDFSDSPYLRPDPYTILVNLHGYMEEISSFERFGLVSSVYGPGNLACWFLLRFFEPGACSVEAKLVR